MRLQFTKMQGLGNDFIVLDGITQKLNISAQQARRLADRKHGVGCDQILMVEAPRQPGFDFGFRIFNADGGEVEQCGNGARCFAIFVRDRGLTDKNEIRVQTRGSCMTLCVQPDNTVMVDMGVPVFEPASIPFIAGKQKDFYQIELNGDTVNVTVLSLGNPHAVQIVDDIDAAPLSEQGPKIESHQRFPNRVNAGFVQIVDRHRARVRVYERGVGETLACGSGACAAVIAGKTSGLLDDQVEVSLRGGDLSVRWAGPGQPVFMTGAANKVFEGEIDLEKM